MVFQSQDNREEPYRTLHLITDSYYKILLEAKNRQKESHKIFSRNAFKSKSHGNTENPSEDSDDPPPGDPPQPPQPPSHNPQPPAQQPPPQLPPPPPRRQLPPPPPPPQHPPSQASGIPALSMTGSNLNSQSPPSAITFVRPALKHGKKTPTTKSSKTGGRNSASNIVSTVTADTAVHQLPAPSVGQNASPIAPAILQTAPQTQAVLPIETTLARTSIDHNVPQSLTYDKSHAVATVSPREVASIAAPMEYDYSNNNTYHLTLPSSRSMEIEHESAPAIANTPRAAIAYDEPMPLTTRPAVLLDESMPAVQPIDYTPNLAIQHTSHPPIGHNAALPMEYVERPAIGFNPPVASTEMTKWEDPRRRESTVSKLKKLVKDRKEKKVRFQPIHQRQRQLPIENNPTLTAPSQIVYDQPLQIAYVPSTPSVGANPSQLEYNAPLALGYIQKDEKKESPSKGKKSPPKDESNDVHNSSSINIRGKKVPSKDMLNALEIDLKDEKQAKMNADDKKRREDVILNNVRRGIKRKALTSKSGIKKMKYQQGTKRDNASKLASKKKIIKKAVSSKEFDVRNASLPSSFQMWRVKKTFG